MRIPALATLNHRDVEQDRLGVTLSGQRRPTERTTINFDNLYSKMTQISTNYQIGPVGLNRNNTNGNRTATAFSYQTATTASNSNNSYNNRRSVYANCTAQAATDMDEIALEQLLAEDGLLDDLEAGLNMTELARRQFREIARVAGLLPPSLPGKAIRSLRQLQASSGLLFDVLSQHDPHHLLLHQARREVLEAQMDERALRELLARCRERRIDLHRPNSLTPLGFPLWAESVRGALSSEDWKTRVQRMAQRLERRHG